MTPLKAIRGKCLDCCAGQANEVRQCPCTDCTLHPYRFGKNPALAGKGKISNLRPKRPTHVGGPARGTIAPGNHIPDKQTAAVFTGRLRGVEIRTEN